MNMDSNGTTGGVPNKILRKVLRAKRGDICNLDFYEEGLSPSRAYCEKLVALGYLTEAFEEDGQRSYTETVLGGRFRCGSFLKPLPKAKADALFEGFMQRIEEINADEKFPLKVKEAFVYGSYLRDQKEYGDIDIYVMPENRRPTWAENEALRDRLIEERGLNLDYMNRLYWPTKALGQRLQNRKLGLNITVGEIHIDTPTKKVFGHAVP